MSVKAEQKRRTHEAILSSAARLLRTRGMAASSVADVMKGAGLTVGGFYAHFASKQALFAETLRGAMRASWTTLLAAPRGAAVLERYLSTQHRDAPAEGCPLPAAIAEVARVGGPAREALAKELDTYVAGFAKLLGGGARARGRALALVSLMVGGLALARALRGTPLGDELLRAAARHGRDMLPG